MSGATVKLEGVKNPFAELLPHCFDVEQELLGVLIVRNDLFMDVSQIITSDHFAEEIHKTLFSAIGMMVASDRIATPSTLKPYVGEADIGKGLTPHSYLVQLAAGACTPANALGYAKQVRDFAARRYFIQSCAKAMTEAWEPRTDITVNDLLRMHEDRVELVRPKIHGVKKGYRSMREVAKSTAQRIQDESNGDVRRVTLTTGYRKLDAKLGGLEAPNLCIIAGRPASGKTALVTNFCVNAAIQLKEEKIANPDSNPGVVGIVSLEMDENQLGERIISDLAQVSGTRIKRRSLEDAHLKKIWQSAYDMADLPIFVDDTGGQSIAQVLARARTLHRKYRLRLLAIDYLQLIKGFRSRSNESRRHEEIGEITAALKELAKELGIPVLLLSQVGRQVDARENKRPNDSDLKESGSIEQDADVILFVYREEAYVIKDKPLPGTEEFAAWERRFEKVKGIAEIIVAKNRFGGVDTIVMGYDGPHTTFLEDPPSKPIDGEEVRQREAKQKDEKLPVKSAILLELVKGLLLHHGRQPTEEEKERQALNGRPLPKQLRIISRDMVFKNWHADRAAGQTEKEAQREYQSAMDVLRERKLTASFGSKEDGVFIWLPQTTG
jgi:replicative DNA helicase